MRIYVRLTVYVVAFAIGHTATEAADDRDWITDITPVSKTSDSSVVLPQNDPSCQPLKSGFNGFDNHRATPDFGAPYSGGFGFQHFALPMHHYTTWYRPRAATLTKSRRCEKDDFRPRGYGHLFARPYDGFRMEYSPFVLCDDESQYGPSYIARQPDQRCNYEHCCDLCDDDDDCDECE